MMANVPMSTSLFADDNNYLFYNVHKFNSICSLTAFRCVMIDRDVYCRVQAIYKYITQCTTVYMKNGKAMRAKVAP